MNKLFYLAALLLISFPGFSQKKKEVKKNHISSLTVYSTENNNGKEFKESVTKYDSNGNPILEEEYKNDGALVKKEESKYTKGDRTEHVVYGSDGKVKKKVVTTWNGSKDKTQEEEYDGNGNLVKKQLFSYNAMGDKVAEIEMDGKGNLVKKSIYVYNSKGLKQEKKTTDAKGNVLYVKRFEYEY